MRPITYNIRISDILSCMRVHVRKSFCSTNTQMWLVCGGKWSVDGLWLV